MKKLDYVDALRGLAIIGVILVHTSQFGTLIGHVTIGKMLTQGARGVQLFYMVSAFTLFLSFKSRIAKEAFPVRNFFIRRFFRIAPMYYIAICFYIFQGGLLSTPLASETHFSALSIISNFTFLHGFNPYWIESIVPGGWSIGVEMTFYAILPFLFSGIKTIKQAFIFFVVSLIISLWYWNFIAEINLIPSGRLLIDFIFLSFPSQLPIFGLGILMYFFIYENKSISKLSGILLLAISWTLLFLLATDISLVFPTYIYFIIALLIILWQIKFKLTTYNPYGIAFLIVGMALSGYGLNLAANPVFTDKMSFIIPQHVIFGMAFLIFGIALSVFRFKLIVNPIIKYIGKISFSMYLVHSAVFSLLVHFNHLTSSSYSILNLLIRLLIVLSLTVLISSFFYRIIEVPFQRLGKRIIDKLENKQVTAEKNPN